MKWDSRDGRVKLIEANPRLSGGGDAAPYAGVDLCWLHYLDLIGQPVTQWRPIARDFRHVVLRCRCARGTGLSCCRADYLEGHPAFVSSPAGVLRPRLA